MNVKRAIKKIVKKPLYPIAKKIRHIADAAVIESGAGGSNGGSISELMTENYLLKKDLDNLEQGLNYIYYYHGGSGNHGCEALVKTITNICKIKREELGIYSYRPEQDKEFGIYDYASFIKHSVLDSDDVLTRYHSGTTAFSIGGDNYCKFPNIQLANYNRAFHESNAKTALIGCSIEPDVMKHGEIIGDLAQFDLISARETITYNALLENGITKNTVLVPDSAFTLKPEPSGITLNPKTVGINISDIALQAAGDLFYKNIVNLIEYILSKTDYSIALIPHVHQDFNDDCGALKKVYAHFLQHDRIKLIGNTFTANQLKDIIGQCSMLVAARTHCSVAGYSMNVPTLVLGYSVKSKGIARDLFGTEENYVKSVHDLKSENDIKNAFIWLDKNQSKIRKHLKEFMPDYIKKAYDIKKHVDKLKILDVSPKIKEGKKARIGTYKKGKLSIITSCYNSASYLHRYLDSILNQTNTNIELVIINDGSTDRTEKILSNYLPLLEKKGIEVVYAKQPNGGIGVAYNNALKYVSGEYFCWCDSDNFYSPDYCEKVLSFFKEHKDANILRHDGYLIDEKDCLDPKVFERTDFDQFSITSENPYEKHLFMNSLLEKNWHFGCIILRTSAFDKLNPKRNIFTSRYGQNWQLTLPLLKEYEAYYIPDHLFYFVMRAASESHQNRKEGDNSMLFRQLDGYHQILEALVNEMNLKNKSELLEILNQKYICKKLEIAKVTKNEKDIEFLTNEFNKKVAPNNLYQKALDKIK